MTIIRVLSFGITFQMLDAQYCPLQALQGMSEAPGTSANSFAEQQDTHPVKNAVTLHRPNCLKMARDGCAMLAFIWGATLIPHCTDSVELG